MDFGVVVDGYYTDTTPKAEKETARKNSEPITEPQPVHEAEGFQVGDAVTINGGAQGVISGFEGNTAVVMVDGKPRKAPFNLLELVTQ